MAIRSIRSVASHCFTLAKKPFSFCTALMPVNTLWWGSFGTFEVHDGLVQPVNDAGVRLPAGLTEQRFYAMLQAA